MGADLIDSSPTLKVALGDYWSRIKVGDIGALPAVLGLVVLCGVFGAMSNVFLTYLLDMEQASNTSSLGWFCSYLRV